VRVVLRSGCYLTHDDGLYARASPLPELRPALELWARVLSCPEPGLAIAGFGKRDAPYDIDLPVIRAASAPERTRTASASRRSTTSTRSSATNAARCESATCSFAGSRIPAPRSTSGR
jgi:D-serine deaminase-like pyridoxal phosphate-dependent protein